ncbi:innexin [Schistosoma bovis]|uniref:Innexin n=1 Tax=Schistosoma bovis TaxID=6184 RepID=A0A430QDL5_SCHBO|nr:innexin [Schistosoma bovis]
MLLKISGKPIQCWVPQEFTHSWEEYAENLCWVQNTYFLHPSDQVPEDDYELTKVRYIGYYQWIAIVLAGQAMLCWVPQILWRVGSKRLPVLLRSAKEASVPDRELRQKAISCLVATLEEQAESTARHRRATSTIKRILCSFRPNTRITFLFFIVRICFIGNSVGQIYLMKKFIGTNSTMFGMDVLNDLITGQEWETSGKFPRVTFCTVRVRKMGQIKPASYTLQCVLPINYFVEKVYVFLWFWFVILSIVTILSTLQWAFNTLVPVRRIAYIKQYIRAIRQLSNTEERDCTRFVNYNLGPDGVLILQVVSRVSSDLIALDVTATLWSNYRHAKITGTEEDINRFLENVNRGTNAV